MIKSIFLSIVGVLFLMTTACSKSDDKSPTTPAPALTTENKDTPKPAAIPEEDNDISRDTALSGLKERKVSLEFRDDVNVNVLGNDLNFQNGEILRSESDMVSGVTCKITVRNGKALLKNDKFQITHKTESGYGTGGSGYLDFQSITQFNLLEDSKIKDLTCIYRGSDALFSTKLSDLDKVFGTWIKVVVYK